MTVYSLFGRLTRLLVIIGLLGQSSDDGVLEMERMRMYESGPYNHLITLIVQHADGSPARGTIACAGEWFKHDDIEARYVESLPFATDSRGAAIFNPLITDSSLSCRANDVHGHTGALTVELSPTTRAIILVH